MKTRHFFFIGMLISAIGFVHTASAQTSPGGDALILEVENRAEYFPFGTRWIKAQTNQVLRVKDRFRTYFKSRATLRM